MEIFQKKKKSEKISKEKPRNLWKKFDRAKYQVKIVDNNYKKFQIFINLLNNIDSLNHLSLKKYHVTTSSIDSATKPEESHLQIIYMDDLEKRKEAYGICGECNEPGTGWDRCQPCNAKRIEENFKNWTSG